MGAYSANCPYKIRQIHRDNLPKKIRQIVPESIFGKLSFGKLSLTRKFWLPVTWLNTIWLNFFVESFGLKILSQVTTKSSPLHSNSRNKYVNSRKYQNAGHMRCMHARPHRRKDQLPLRSLRDLRSR